MAQFTPPQQPDYVPLLLSLLGKREERSALERRRTLDMERRLLQAGAESGGDVRKLAGLTPVIPTSEVDAYIELSKIAKKRLSEQQAQQDVPVASQGLGSTLASIQSGTAHPQALTTMLQNLQATYGDELTSRIASRGAGEFANLRAGAEAEGAKQTGILNRQILVSQLKQAEKDRTPEGLAKAQEARLQLRILDDGPDVLTSTERAFLDERVNMDPLKAFRRDVLGSKATAPVAATEAETEAVPEGPAITLRQRFEQNPLKGGWSVRGMNQQEALVLENAQGRRFPFTGETLPAATPKAAKDRERKLRMDFKADPATKGWKIVGVDPDGALIAEDKNGIRRKYAE